MKLVRLIAFAGLLVLGAPSLPAQGKSQARLVLSAEAAKPGDTVWAAVELRMPPGWHTYWRNPGESGSATTIEWELPPGLSAGEILWPVPEKYTQEGLTTYVYHGRVGLLVPIQVAETAPQGTVQLKAAVSWLECEKLCLPGSASVAAALTIGPETKPSKEAEFIETWRKRVPIQQGDLSVQARWGRPVPGKEQEERLFTIEWATGRPGLKADFYPYESEQYTVDGKTETEAGAGDGKTITLKKTLKRSEGAEWPAQVAGVLVAQGGAGTQPEAYEVLLALGGETGAAGSTRAEVPVPAVGGSSRASLWAMLGLAFLGGLILNIMPCVLPVIALKILGFVNQSREEPGRVRMLGLVYGLGVLVSFLALAGLVIGVQQAGRAASWGMQFQNPQFLVAITVLVTLVALNLFGLFEINLGARAMGAAGTLAAREGATGAFFNGVLATILATPCTAPFLGVALGFAFAQPPWVVVLMFLTVGLGLAAPYVVLSWYPQWLKFLPKPGAWMERFKVAMGFPMLATAIWLLWLTTNHFGTEGTLWLGLFLVIVGLAAWVWGEFVQRGGRRRGWAMALSVLLVAGGYLYALERELRWRSPELMAQVQSGKRAGEEGIDWQVWSREAVDAARAAGHPVLVDFTAEWCLSCKLNKRRAIEIPATRAKLKEIGAVAFKADHTLPNPEITEELKRYDRAGVPLVLVFPPDLDEPAIVLPEFLNPETLLEALDKAAGSRFASDAKRRAAADQGVDAGGGGAQEGEPQSRRVL